MTHEHSVYHIRARNILATALRTRYDYTGDLPTCHLAVRCLEDALKVCPHQPLRILLVSALGLCLQLVTEKTRDYSQFDRLVEVCEEAVDICPKHHLRRVDCVTFLADTYIKGYHWKGDMNMLNKGIALFEQLLQDVPPDNGQRHQCLFLTSLGLAARVENTGSKRDLERGIEYAKEALDIMKTGHPVRYMAHICLSQLHLHDYRLHGSENALERSISHLSLTMTDSAGGARDKLSRSVVLLRLIRAAMISPTTGLLQALLTAYQQTLALLPKVVLVGMDVKSRLRDLEQTEQLAVAAAEVALMLGRPDVAVECLEEGRSVFWAQGLALRSSFDDFPEEMTIELKTITNELERYSYASIDATSGETKEIPEDVGVQMRRLGVRFDLLIDQARKLPGLDGYLSHLMFPMLCQAIGSNTVVLLLASSAACQAIIVTGSESPLCVPFHAMTVTRLAEMASLIKSENTWFRSRMGIEQECHERSFIRRDITLEPDETMEGVLNDLWRHVIQPVINALGLEVSTYCHRDKWCD
jgi:tetratricopeptide (TPR) repeat protein